MTAARLRVPSVAFAALLAIGGIGLGVGSLLLVHRAPAFSLAGPSVAGGAALLGAGWLAMGVGLGAWRRRPGDGFGPLLAVAGALWFVTEWASPAAGSPLVFTAGLALHTAFPPFVAHAALVNATAPEHGAGRRAVLATAYAAAIAVAGLGPALFFDPIAQGCNACPRNLLLISDLPAVAGLLERTGAAIGLAALGALGLMLGARLVRATPAARALTAPVSAPAALLMATAAAVFGTWLRGGRPAVAVESRELWWVLAASLAGVAAGFLGIRLRMRRARRRLAELVVELDSSPQAGGLSPALAAALGDPGLIVAYRIGDGSYVDAAGNPAPLSATPGTATTAVVREGETLVVLLHDPDLLGDPRLVEEVASAARLGLESERLQAETRAQLAELVRSRLRIVESGDAERRRLERDLHDGAQQSLVGITLALRLLRIRLGGRFDGSVTSRLAEAEAEMRGAVDDLRRLARGFHPAVLSDGGLAAAVAALAEEQPIRATGLPAGRFPPAVEAAAYHLVADAVATGPVSVTTAVDATRLRLDITMGREPDGLPDLEDRVGALGGSVEVGPAEGGELHLRAEIPCGS